MYLNTRCSSQRILSPLWVCLFLVSGCATEFTRTAGGKAGLCGQEAADSAIGFYESLRTVADDNTYYQGYLRIVVSPEPDKVDFTRVSDADLSREIEPRIKTYRAVRTAYSLFQQLCADESGKSAGQSYAALTETLRALSADETTLSETKKLATALPGDFAARCQVRRIAQAQVVLEKLSSELATLWDKEIPIWDDYIDGVYIRHYASGLLSLRLANFDEKELAKAVSDPYGISVKAGLFKLQKYREATLKAAKLKAELRQVSKTFHLLDVLQRQVASSSASLAETRLIQDAAKRQTELDRKKERSSAQ